MSLAFLVANTLLDDVVVIYFIFLCCSALDLRQRLEYLSRAVMSAKSAAFRSDSAEGDLLHELEEKLDVSDGI